jgi:centromere protein C
VYDHDLDEKEEEDDDGEVGDVRRTNGAYADEVVEPSIEDDGPMFVEDNDDFPVEADQTAVSIEQTQTESEPKRKRGRPRRSDQSNNSLIEHSPVAGPSNYSSKKRDRRSLENAGDLDESGSARMEEQFGARSKKSRTSNGADVIVHRDDHTETIDPTLLAHGDEYMVDADDYAGEQPESEVEAQLESQLAEPEPEPPTKGRGRPKGKGKVKVAKEKVPKERDANRSMQQRGSPVKLNDSPSKIRQRGGSTGPVSNVHLRAITPAQDAGQMTSRAGRNLIQPLKFWENEALIWKSGEIEGIIRADPVEKPKPKTTKRKRKGKKRTGLDDIEEESETESTMADEWEEEIGVITGHVASWNPLLKNGHGDGDPDEPLQEGKLSDWIFMLDERDTLTIPTDIAFAASSIITRDVPASAFKYAKIMTMPFFGAGVVELPPEGFKRAKNSRRMQMVFFVHEGKVLVEVGATGLEVNEFALSKGGVWVVPRGMFDLVVFPFCSSLLVLFLLNPSDINSVSPRIRPEIHHRSAVKSPDLQAVCSPQEQYDIVVV